MITSFVTYLSLRLSQLAYDARNAEEEMEKEKRIKHVAPRTRFFDLIITLEHSHFAPTQPAQSQLSQSSNHHAFHQHDHRLRPGHDGLCTLTPFLLSPTPSLIVSAGVCRQGRLLQPFREPALLQWLRLHEGRKQRQPAVPATLGHPNVHKATLTDQLLLHRREIGFCTN